MRVDTRPHDQPRGRQVALGTAGHRAPTSCDAPEPVGLGERERFHSLQVDAPGERGPALGSSPASCPCASVSPGESPGRELGLLRSWAALEVGSRQNWGCQAPPTSSMREEGGGSARFLDKENWGKSRQKGSRVAHCGASPPGADRRAPCPPP